MKTTIIAAGLVSALSAGAMPAAEAHDGVAPFIVGAAVGAVVAGSVFAPRVAYVAPPPVVYAPPPVAYAPAPVVYAQAPVVYAPAVVYPPTVVVRTHFWSPGWRGHWH